MRDAAGLAQVVVTDAGLRAPVEALTEETVVEVDRHGGREPDGARRGRAGRRRRYGRSARPPSRRRSTCTGRRSPRPCRPSSTTRRWRCGTRRRPAALRIVRGGGRRASGPRWTRRASSRSTPRRSSASATESGANVFALDYFGRPGVPGPVAAVLQAADGRRLRAGLRGRAGVPGRAARHRPAPGPVHVARRRAGLHRRPPRRDGGAARRPRRDARRGRASGPGRAGALGVGRARGAGGDPGGALRRGAARSPARRPDEPDLAPAHERALGEWARARARLGLPLRHRLPDGEAAVLHPPGPGPAGVLERLRPAVPRAGAGHRRAAAAPVRRLRGRARGARASRSSRTRPTWTRSGTACRRTAGSRSGWSGSWPG